MRLRKRMMKVAYMDFNEALFKSTLKDKYQIYKQYRHLLDNNESLSIGGGSMNGFYTVSPYKSVEELRYRDIIDIKQHILDKISYYDNVDFEKLNTLDSGVMNFNNEETVVESIGSYKSSLSQMAGLIMDGFYAQQLGEDIKNKK
jgi:hypothetical protein